MRQRVVVVLVALVPVLLFANVFQAFRYSQLDREVTRMEQEQRDLLEENKRIILAIALLSSPSRIGALADSELDLERIDTSDITRMIVPSRGDDQ